MGDAGENLNRRKFLSEGFENGKETYLRVMDQQECLVMKKGCREGGSELPKVHFKWDRYRPFY